MKLLSWIRNPIRKFKLFVANPVGKIQTLTKPKQWMYLPSKENSADLLTRGVSVSVLSTMQDWWNGPKFVMKYETHWPLNRFCGDQLPERKNVAGKEHVNDPATRKSEPTIVIQRTMIAFSINKTLA